MFPLVLLAALGQMESYFAGTWKECSIRCEQGHPAKFWGWQQPNGDMVARFSPRDRPAAEGRYLTGVDSSRLPQLAPGKEWFGGNAQAISLAAAPGGRMNRVHLTFIGRQADREAARKDLERSPDFRRLAEEMGDRLAVQDYGPENPLVKDIGLVDGGTPDIIIQTTEKGRVAYRAHKYPGSDVLINEIRKADPRYNPKNDPPGGGTLLGFLESIVTAELQEYALGLMLGLGGIVFLQKVG